MIKTRFLAFFTLSVLMINSASFVLADTPVAKSRARAANDLVAMLPDSDGVATIDVKRFFNDAMPKILAANQPMLGKIMAEINSLSNKTGIDLRKFDQVAFGAKFKGSDLNNMDVDAVAIARGDINAGALVAVAKLASKGTYREEKIGERTLYIFNAKEIAEKHTADAKKAGVGDVMDKVAKELTQEMAITSFDSNTLVFGSVDSVRRTLDRTTSVRADITAMLSSKETSVLTFAIAMPEMTSKVFGLDNDELGKNVDSIRYMSGSMDVSAAGASFAMAARTKTTEQAKSLAETISGLQMVGKAFLGGSKRADQRVYAKLLETAKVTVRDNDVTLDLAVAQADIDLLVAKIK